MKIKAKTKMPLADMDLKQTFKNKGKHYVLMRSKSPINGFIAYCIEDNVVTQFPPLSKGIICNAEVIITEVS